MATALIWLPLALTAASTSASSGPVNLTGLSNQGVLVVKLCCGRASIIFMSKRALSPAFFSAILPVTVRMARSLGASSASAVPEIERPASNRQVVKARRVFLGVISTSGGGGGGQMRW